MGDDFLYAAFKKGSNPGNVSEEWCKYNPEEIFLNKKISCGKDTIAPFRNLNLKSSRDIIDLFPEEHYLAWDESYPKDIIPLDSCVRFEKGINKLIVPSIPDTFQFFVK